MSGYHLIVSIVVLSMVVIFVSFVHLCAKWFWYRREAAPNTRARRRRDQGVTVLRRGLNPSFLETIPVVPFDPRDFKEGLECAVCLSELGEGEKTRILPKCNHGFHVECIDMWFYSHSTCPICRNPVSVETVENLLETQEEFPTNILFWGDETEVSTLTSQLEEANSYHQTPAASSQTDLVIDIPRQNDYDEDHKSPVSSRMRSLLSGSRRFTNPFSPAIVEQGTRGHLMLVQF